MFCQNCGQIVKDDARFCKSCGNKITNLTTKQIYEPDDFIITIPVHLNISLLTTENYIFRLERRKCGLLKVNQNAYSHITDAAVSVKDKEKIFNDYAKGLNSKPLEAIISDYLGSIEFDNIDIQSLVINTYYDSDFHRDMDYDRFKLVTTKGKYRGSIDRETDISSYHKSLQLLLGNRYKSKEIVHSFDS